ncbi:hypothetical protein D3C80_1478020 [compost metagenome]
MRGDSNHRPGDQCADRDHAPDDGADFTPFGEMQGKAAFEEDQRYRQGNQWE